MIKAVSDLTDGKRRVAETTLRLNPRVAALLAEARGKAPPTIEPDLRLYLNWTSGPKSSPRHDEHRLATLQTKSAKDLAQHLVGLEEVQRDCEERLHANALAQAGRLDLLPENPQAFTFPSDTTVRYQRYLRKTRKHLSSRCLKMEDRIRESQAILAEIDHLEYQKYEPFENPKLRQQSTKKKPSGSAKKSRGPEAT
ncbi:hypothetical protein [Deinococcus aquatilis]|uniref:hypothetical protein n=1 Tax=Deinococcus aquatilis TaxID=519440 RepID=UPI0012FA208D|nr:hypothetical protein [Deinococcus aquatilis]